MGLVAGGALLLLAASLSPAFAAGPGDCSGVMTTGGTSQAAAAANANRSFIFIENPSATASGVTAESLFINWGAVANGTISANTGSVELANGQSITFNTMNMPQTLLSMVFNAVAATTGHKFICKQG